MTASIKGVSLMLAGTIFVAACQNESQTQRTALNAAMRRGQFELGCSTASGTVISNNVLQPVQWGGAERALYTIGIEGCGKRATYVSICPVVSFGSTDCFAAAGMNNANISQQP